LFKYVRFFFTIAMSKFGDLIYTPESASGEAISKVETHTPKIEAPEKVEANKPFEIHVSVGPHPNVAAHSIRWIEIYFYEEGRSFNPIHIATVKLAPGYAEPDIRISLKIPKSGVIYAIEYCNLHGLWESRKKVEVV